MTETIVIYSALGALIIMMVLGIVISLFMPMTDRWSKQYCVVLFSLTLLCSISCFLAMLFWGNPRMAAAERVVYFLESLLFSSLTVMPTLFLLHSSGKSTKNSPLLNAVMVLLGVYYVMLIIAQFTKVFYYVTPVNQYVRKPAFAITVIPLTVIMILNVVFAVKKRKKLSKRIFQGLMIYLLPMTAAIISHMFFDADILIVLCMALFVLIMFCLILADNIDHFMRQQRRIASQRANITVLQMRPHFVSNTLMSIYYLCDKDPQKAKQVTLDFTTYLRKNFTALASEDTIPFASELEHTRAYLAVEQAQFEDSLFVTFDTPHTLFRIPPLTLQPIVENSVKHGLRASNDPIHILVVTRKTDTGNEIIVEDDGPGFNPVDDNEPHIALNNIRLRLELMCKGTLTIAQREGGGTSVKVTIPLSDE